jgi:hypothetical protein
MKRVLFMTALLALLAVPTALWAQVKVVQFKDGRPPLIGTVNERADGYEVTTPAGKQVVPIDQVAEITDYLSPREEFRKRQGSLAATDVAGHFALADWAYRQGLLEEARGELKLVLMQRPGHENAQLLLNVVEKAIQAKAPRSTSPAAPAAHGERGSELLGQMMSMDDVQRIRRAELRSGDQIAVEFRNDVLRRYVEVQYKDNPGGRQAFNNKPPVAKAVEMIEQAPTTPEIQNDILIKGDGRFMKDFKQRVWPIIARQCASPDCHGAPKGMGRVKLYATPIADDRVYYTNFYILDTFERNVGRMIDRNIPEKSLLLQYSLQPGEGRMAHPGVPAAFVKSPQEEKYQIMLAWIQEGLLNPHPEYLLDYRAAGQRPRGSILSLGSQPASRPASRPASAPASQPARGPKGR